MDTDFIPASPWLNPVIDDGIYNATIEDITESTYGPDDNRFVRLLLWLDEPAIHLATNFYRPRDSRSQYRLNYLCRCVDCDLLDVFDAPYLLERRELRVEICVTRPHDGVGRLYSDVKSFIPPEGHLHANEDNIEQAKKEYAGRHLHEGDARI
ncbi:MAG: hypothetical protein IID37_01665 [Planctomycetes bacterium]|nr:hypothetical protein [Planctomycetota bacterium]